VRGATYAAAGGGGIILVVIGAIFLVGLMSASPPTQGVSASDPPRVTGTLTALSGPQAQLVHLLREARERIGLSVNEAGRRAEIPASRISEIEQGLTVPTAREVDVLSGVYQLSPDEWTSLVRIQSTIE
jgi:hypothetical protein